MMSKFKDIIFLSMASLLLTAVFASVANAQGVAASSSGLFDNEILEGMHLMMISTYKTLGNVLMVGHSLMCYAINVAKTHILDKLYIPDISLWIVGLSIYTVGVFMALSVGMYFVDASLRLGVAILFMPVSIALWPFPPTSGKFMENLGTIIRNGMLFMLMAVGVSFAICLVNAGLFEGGDQAFWNAINMAQTESISENFSFFNSHILVVGFSLVFGFRLLESSVNNYLEAFFSDSMFGSDSPMNKMSTQIIGMASQNIAKPAMSWAKDVATHQTGRLITGAGTMLTHEGRKGIADKFKTAGHIMLNPRQSYNKAMQKIGSKVDKGLQNLGDNTSKVIMSAGSGVQKAVDAFTALMPIPASEDLRQDRLYGKLQNGVRPKVDMGKSISPDGYKLKEGLKANKGINNKIGFVTQKFAEYAKEKIDNVAPDIGRSANAVISKGGGELKKGLAPAVSKAVTMGQTATEGAKQAIASKLADGINEVNDLLGREEPAISANEVRAGLHSARVIAGGKIGGAVEGVSKVVDKVAKSKVVQGTTKLANNVVNSQIVQGLKEGIQNADQPIIKLKKADDKDNAFKTIKGTKEKHKLISSVKRLASDAGTAFKDSKGQRTRIIAKASGQIVARTAKGVGKDVGSSVDFVGHTLQDFGRWFGNNKRPQEGNGKKKNAMVSMMQSWQSIGQEEDRKKANAAELSEYYRGANVDEN